MKQLSLIRLCTRKRTNGINILAHFFHRKLPDINLITNYQERLILAFFFYSKRRRKSIKEKNIVQINNDLLNAITPFGGMEFYRNKILLGDNRPVPKVRNQAYPYYVWHKSRSF